MNHCKKDEESNYRDKCVTELMRTTLKRARIKEMTLNISKKFLIQLWNQQNGSCALTGIKFNDFVIGETKRRPYTASIDRIDSQKGYIAENVRLVCAVVNMALFVWGDSVFDHIVRSRHDLIYKCGKERTDITFQKIVPEVGGRGLIERRLDLPTGWFCRREREGLPVPEPEANKGKFHKYNILKVVDWLNSNQDAVNWAPPEMIVRESQYGGKYFYRTKNN